MSFLNTVLDWAIDTHRVDPSQIVVTGSSNGGMMTYRMLVERPERFAAGAAFIANMPEEPVPAPAEPVSVLIMNGDADPLMPWAGGPVGLGSDPVRSGPATLQYWLAVNGLAGVLPDRTPLPDGDPQDGTRILESVYRDEDAAPGVSVAFYRVVNGGHAIPFPEAPGGASRDAHGVDVAWAFLDQALLDARLEAAQDRLRSPVSIVTDYLPMFDTRCKAADLDGDGRVSGEDLIPAAGLVLTSPWACAAKLS